MPETKSRKFVYPSPAKCPRCHSVDTVARRTDNERGIQYRRCRRAICRWRFAVTGTPVEPEPQDAAGPEEVFRCPHCEAVYQRQSGLTRHINSKHGGTNDDGTEETE